MQPNMKHERRNVLDRYSNLHLGSCFPFTFDAIGRPQSRDIPGFHAVVRAGPQPGTKNIEAPRYRFFSLHSFIRPLYPRLCSARGMLITCMYYCTSQAETHKGEG